MCEKVSTGQGVGSRGLRVSMPGMATQSRDRADGMGNGGRGESGTRVYKG